MIKVELNPVFLNIGNFSITYYLLFAFLSFIFTLYFLIKAIKKNEIEMQEAEAYELAFLSLISILFFARLFHILFWDIDYFYENPSKIFYLKEGGFSFHGLLVGAILSTAIYTKIKNINFFKLVDIVIVPATFGFALLRVANFINVELIGKITNVPWCVMFAGIETCRHPVQLYSSLTFLIIFIILIFLKSKNLKEGSLFFTFLFLSGLSRFITDFFLQDETYFYLTAGQWLSIPMVLTGIFFIKSFLKSPLQKPKLNSF